MEQCRKPGPERSLNRLKSTDYITLYLFILSMALRWVTSACDDDINQANDLIQLHDPESIHASGKSKRAHLVDVIKNVINQLKEM